MWNEEGIATEFTYALELEARVGQTIEYTNTAWIKETEKSDSVTVDVTGKQATVPVQPPAPKPPAPQLPLTGANSAWLLAVGENGGPRQEASSSSAPTAARKSKRHTAPRSARPRPPRVSRAGPGHHLHRSGGC